MLRITSARPLSGFWVELTLSDGSSVERDLEDLMRGPVFEAIRTDRAMFALLRVRRGTVEWPGDIDLDPAVLLWNGTWPRDPSATPEPRLVLRHPSSTPTIATRQSG